MNIPVNDSRQLRTHTCFVAWNNVRGRTPPLNKTGCHVHENTHANEAVSTHDALSVQLNNTPNLVKRCSVVLEIQYIVVSE